MTQLLIGIVLVLALLAISYKLLKPYFLERKRKQRYQRILQIIEPLYQQTNPYMLSKSAKNYHQDESLTYGEIDPCALLDLLAFIQPSPQDIFFDLGSGSGKTLITTKLGYPQMEVVGIERLEPLHDLAEEMGQSIPPPHARFICDNFLTYDISPATILFINATAFMPELWEPLKAKLQDLKTGTKIIITSKQLPLDSFIQLYGAMEKTSWGLCSTYIYEKR